MYLSLVNDLTKVGLSAERRHYNSRPLDFVWNLTAGQQPETRALPSQFGDAELDNIATQPSGLPKIEIGESLGRGLGLFATEYIPAYARILEDDPLLSLAKGEDLPELWQKYLLLPPELKKQFDELSYGGIQSSREDTLVVKLRERGHSDEEAKIMARVSSRFQANAFQNGSAAKSIIWACSLFPTVARLNHSCAPNAHAHYRPSSGAQLVYSLRDINPGEEIEISYFNITIPFDDRQERAKAWGFICSCSICTQVRKSKSHNNSYEKLLASVRSGMTVQPNADNPTVSSTNWIHDVEQAINIAHSPNYSWLVAALPGLYYCLGKRLEQAKRPPEKIQEAFTSALRWECRLTGAESPSSEERRKQLRAVVE